MGKIPMDKVKQAFSNMDNDSYWEAIVSRLGAIEKQSAQVLADYTATLTQLSVTQVGLLEAKYLGYKRLAECTDESAHPQIIAENKAQISSVLNEKNQHTATLVTLLAQLQALSDEAQTMGEANMLSGLVDAKGG